METKLLRDTTEDINTASQIIRDGGIVAMPTETVYGLAANALDGKGHDDVLPHDAHGLARHAYGLRYLEGIVVH